MNQSSQIRQPDVNDEGLVDAIYAAGLGEQRWEVLPSLWQSPIA